MRRLFVALLLLAAPVAAQPECNACLPGGPPVCATSPASGEALTYDGSEACWGTLERSAISDPEIEPVVIDTPDDADSYILFKAPYALTIEGVDCIVDPADTGESVVIDIRECDSSGDSCTTIDATITCDNDGAADDGTLSNADIDAGDWILIDVGTVTGTVTYVSTTIRYNKT